MRQRRRDLGLTQTELASRAGVSRRWLSGVEAGKSSVEFGLITKTLDALGMVLDARPYEPAPARSTWTNCGVD